MLGVLIKSDFQTGADAVDADPGYSAEAGPGLLMLQSPSYRRTAEPARRMCLASRN